MKNTFSGSVYVHERACRENNFWRAIRDLGHALAQSRRTAMLAGVLLLVAPLAAFGQNNAVRQRVIDRVDVSRLATLPGNTHPLARPQYDQGAAPADLPVNRMMLVLKRSPEQESALQDLLTQQQITASANFRKWLTPDQFGQQFGLADADIQAVTSWLASYGFQSVNVSKGRNVIEFSGTASQVEAALHTPIHRYVVNGESHWANASEPQIPAALAPVISGFVSLHNFRKVPTLVRSNQKVTATITPGVKPQINLQNLQGTTIHALVPGDFNTIYHVDTSSMTGSGVTIGIISNSNINVQDVRDFRSMFLPGLPPNDPIVIVNGPDPGDVAGSVAEGEAILDATWSGAVAPSAKVDLVVSEDTNVVSGADLSEVYIVDNNLADIMTESFSGCEANFSGNASFYFSVAEQAAAQGITYLVASGDGGPDSCDDPSTEPPATTTPSVNILASTPFTVAVGGTQFNDGPASTSPYWNANETADGGSAKSYIPENVWNESCTPAQVGQAGCPASGLWSSGGGASTIFGASTAFPTTPPWQAGVTGLPSGNHPRLVPDVSLTAADHDGYVLCIDASCQGSNVTFGIASGTSASAQAFGGIMALVVQKVGARVGNANYALYKLAAGEPPTAPANSTCNGSNTTTLPASTCIFNDTTVGNTNIPVSNPVETGFTAGTGYDEATGLGSVNVSNLVNNWHTAIVNGTTTTLTLNNGNPVNVTHGTPVPVGISVSAVAGTPTGDVSLISNTSATDKGIDGFPLSNGAVSAAVNSTILLPGGTYQVHAHYAGDKTFLGSDSTPGITVTVTPQSSQINFGIVIIDAITGACSTSTSVAYGSSYILTVDVADALAATTACAPSVTGSSPSGTVHVSDNGGNLDGGTGNFKLNSFGYFEDQIIQLSAGTHTIKATYVGDNSFTGSNSSTVIAVTQATTTTSVAANPTTAAVGQSVTLTATVGTQSNAIANSLQEPKGNLQFFLGGVALGAPAAVTGSATSGGFAQAVASISTTTLANGLNSITAKYLGDSNYAASAVSPSVTVTVGQAGINIAPGCNSATITIASPGQSGSCLITVTGANLFAGTVTLTAAVTAEPAGAVDLPTCSFGAPDQNFTAPGTITLSTSSETGNATMTCGSMAASGALVRPSNRRHGPNGLLIAEMGAALACMFLLTITSRKRRGMVTLAAVLFMVLAAVTGCGTSNNSGGGNPGTTLGAYTVTVTATPSTGTAQTSAITVNVK